MMAGISSKALNFGEPDNKKKYNGIEKEDGLGIEIYDAQLRELDPQIGRWWQIDPKVENMEMWSPYASNYDNPIRYSDPLGDEGGECCAGLKQWLGERWEAQKRGTWLAGKRIGEAVSQGWGNAKNNWNAGNDPVHQAMMYPMSTIGGIGVEANVAKGLIKEEVKTVAKEVAEETFKADANQVTQIFIKEAEHPEAAQHALEAAEKGIKTEGVIDRAGKSERRKANLKGIETQRGKDRDEFPPAVIKTDGPVSVKLISSSDNRGAGGSIGQQIKNLPDNTRVEINVIPKIKKKE